MGSCVCGGVGGLNCGIMVMSFWIWILIVVLVF